MFIVILFSGVKRTGFLGGEVPSLFSQCIQVLKENVDYIEEVGGLPYDIMKPVLLMASDTTLMRIEDCNPHLMEFTGEVSCAHFNKNINLSQPLFRSFGTNW